MKILFLALIFIPLLNYGQFKPTKNDALIAGLQLIAGAADGLREEVLYHPNNLFKTHPNLNRGWWDSRVSWKNGGWAAFKDANHAARVTTQTFDLISIGAALFEKRPATRRDLWKRAATKVAIGYLSRKLGFGLVYYTHFKNKR